MRLFLNRRRLVVLPLILILACAGCSHYSFLPDAYRDTPPVSSPPAAYVINPELEHERQLLADSGIYRLTEAPSADIHVRLYPLQAHLGCGYYSMGAFFTLGLKPSVARDQYIYRFDEIRAGQEIRHEIELVTLQRTSFWELFRGSPTKDECLAEGIRGAFLSGESSPRQCVLTLIGPGKDPNIQSSCSAPVLMSR